MTSPLYSQGKSEGSIQNLVDSLSDENVFKQQESLESLVKIGAEAVPYLIKALDSDSRDKTANALEALGLIGDISAVPKIMDLLRKHSKLEGREGLKDQYIRVNSIKALGRLKSRDAIPLLEETMHGERLIDKAWCMISLYEIEPTQARLQEVIGIAKSDDPTIRNVIIKFLSERKEPLILPVLKEALSDKEWYVRDSAAQGIGQVGSKENIGWLKPLLKDPVPIVVETAKSSIEKLKK
ncbi:HEAT repeat domain-containing protein [bacterium]|nr:HEAT repeat domain-containing protein [bacterium]